MFKTAPEQLLKLTTIQYKGYRVFRNAEGFLEPYKKLKSQPDLRRIVTTCRTEDELREAMKKPRQKKYDPWQDPNQLRIE